jgi:hypothetical protein
MFDTADRRWPNGIPQSSRPTEQTKAETSPIVWHGREQRHAGLLVGRVIIVDQGGGGVSGYNNRAATARLTRLVDARIRGTIGRMLASPRCRDGLG